LYINSEHIENSIDAIDVINNIGVAVWVEDASALYVELQRLEKVHAISISQYLGQNPHEIPRLIDLIRIIDVNDETVTLFKAKHKQELLQGIRNFFIKESYYDFMKMLINLYNGKNQYKYTSSKITRHGHKLVTQVTVNIPAKCENDWSQMIVSEFDISHFIKNEVSLKVSTEKQKLTIDNKDKLISIIAHDLKNPFNNILGFSELLLAKFDVLDQETIKSFVQYIHESAGQSYHLLNNLLHWGKLQDITSACKIEECIVSESVKEVVELLNTATIAKKISIHSCINNSHIVYADKHMLTFIIRNIVTNSIKFSEEESIITVTSYLKNNKTYILIADTGMGMDDETKTNLFNGKSNSSKSGTSNETGTGIGLMLCKEFVDTLYGTISVNSKLGEGTQITIELPAVKHTYL